MILSSSSKTLSRVLIKIDRLFNETTVTQEGYKIAIDPTWMKGSDAVRWGVVQVEPVNNPHGFKVNDLIFFHPNQVKPTLFRGKEQPAMGELVKELGLYVIEQGEIYAIQRGDELIPVGENCFVLPFKDMVFKDDIGLEIPDSINIRETEFFGIMKYANDTLRSYGVNDGNMISFNYFSKHKFIINDEIMFRMRTCDIDTVIHEY
jgi:hypothetical protein